MTTSQKLRRARQLMTVAVLQDDNLDTDAKLARIRILEGMDAPARKPAPAPLRTVWLQESRTLREQDDGAAELQARATELLNRLEPLSNAVRKREPLGGLALDVLDDVMALLKSIADPETAAEQAATEAFVGRVCPGALLEQRRTKVRRRQGMPATARDFVAAIRR